MPIFEPGAIIRVPFPQVETKVRETRPALVVAPDKPAGQTHLLWALMITSAQNRGWAGDLPIPDHRACGLPIPCVIRTGKIAVFETRIATLLGRIDDTTLKEVRSLLRERLELDRI